MIAGEPSAKRSLQPAFNAAAAQAGMPLCDLQPFEPLLLGEADAGSLTPHHTGKCRQMPMHCHRDAWPKDAHLAFYVCSGPQCCHGCHVLGAGRVLHP